MVHRRLGHSGLELSPIGFGAFKIGRNQGIKYAHEYELPTDEEVSRLVNGVLDLGINYIDTAPAYGTSEERVGRALRHRKADFLVSTKVGETFRNGKSRFDFSEKSVLASIEQSLERLQTDRLDIVFVHSDGRDLEILQHPELMRTLIDLRMAGVIRTLGFSGKTVQGAVAALFRFDVIMVEYNLEDRSHEDVIAEAAERGVGVIVKKGLASGRLPAHEAIQFVLSNPNVTSMVIGGLNLEHFRENVRAAESALR